MELLERVVRDDGGIGPVGDLEDERVAAPYHSGRRGDDASVVDRLPRRSPLTVGDAMLERGVDDHRDVGEVILVTKCRHGLVELLQTRFRATFGRDVRSVDHGVRTLRHRVQSTTRVDGLLGSARASVASDGCTRPCCSISVA